MSKIKVIIPAYNEEKLLHTLLKEIPSVSEIIIISNNSTDNTIKVATELVPPYSERKGMAMLA
jgi:glycosyltransferase involved in cell wall biosynthesis